MFCLYLLNLATLLATLTQSVLYPACTIYLWVECGTDLFDTLLWIVPDLKSGSVGN